MPGPCVLHGGTATTAVSLCACLEAGNDWKIYGKSMENLWQNHGKPWKHNGNTMDMFRKTM